MKIRMFLLGLVALGALSLGSSAFAQSTHSHPATVVTTKQTSLGVILVTGSGQTLYLDGADRPGHSACTGGCLSIWPRLKAGGAPKATGGAKASLLGTIKVAGGSRQVTYHGHPLYTFASATTGTSGEGEGGFYVVSPSGKKIVKSTDATTTTTTTTTAPW